MGTATGCGLQKNTWSKKQERVLSTKKHRRLHIRKDLFGGLRNHNLEDIDQIKRRAFWRREKSQRFIKAKITRLLKLSDKNYD